MPLLAPNRFEEHLAAAGCRLDRARFEVLQVNVGRLCNQTCRHCHVTAGPGRTEIMPREVADRCIELVRDVPTLTTLDITGGAPELNDNFRPLALAGRERGLRVIDRCNLTVLSEPGQEDLADFLAENEIEIIASLPCYTAENVDRQRGDGVFARSIEALRLLNGRGYGERLRLDLVYNPQGPSLPPPQASLEADYKKRLREDFGVEFSNLLCIANIPIGRFRTDLKSRGALDGYIDTLSGAFNAGTVERVMCRTHLSIDWRGYVYDCDFNQMIDLPLGGDRLRNIMDASIGELLGQPIATGDHCLGCTAGAGSSCSGALG